MINVVDWRITSKCNNSCLYCYASENLNELNLNQKLLIVDKIASNCNAVCITGGEPLLNSQEIIYMLRYIFNKGINIFLSTNGTNFLDNASSIIPYIERVSLPLDGYDDISNCCNNRKIGSFNVVHEILKHFENISRSQLPFVKINTTITNMNCNADLLLEMNSFLSRFSVIDLWEIYEFIPENRGISNMDNLMFQALSFSDLIDSFESRVKVRFKKIVYASRNSRNSVYFIIRPDGSVMIPIDNGEVVNEVIVGNLLNDDFKTVEEKWTNYANEHGLFMNQRLQQKR